MPAKHACRWKGAFDIEVGLAGIDWISLECVLGLT